MKTKRELEKRHEERQKAAARTLFKTVAPFLLAFMILL